MELRSRVLGIGGTLLMLLHPSMATAGSRTNPFTKAPSEGTFQNPAATNHFGDLIQGTLRRGGGPSAACPTCPSSRKDSGDPRTKSSPSGGGLTETDCPTCGGGPNLKVAGCTKCGEPETLLVHSGEFFYTKTDLVIPGVGLDFRMARVYRSEVSYGGPLGLKWEFSHNVRLTELANGSVNWLGMGRSDGFQLSGSTYTNSPGWFGTLTKTTSPLEFKFVEPSGLSWRFEDDSVSATGFYRLKERKDRSGNTLTYAYDNATPTRKLTKVTDTVGRDVTLEYDANGLITKVFDFGSPSHREVIYGYDSSGRLTSVRSPTVEAEGNEDDYGSGKTTTYAYDSNDRLVTIFNPRDTSTPYLINLNNA